MTDIYLPDGARQSEHSAKKKLIGSKTTTWTKICSNKRKVIRGSEVQKYKVNFFALESDKILAQERAKGLKDKRDKMNQFIVDKMFFLPLSLMRALRHM